MDSTIFSMVFGIGFLVLICIAFYRLLSNKSNSGNRYTPYDDMTRGTNDTNAHMDLQEDTRHVVQIEENQTIE